MSEALSADEPATPDEPDQVTERLLAAAHDLRTPLSSIRGFTDVLIRGGDRITDEQRTDYLARIAAAAAKLDDLITTLTHPADPHHQ